MALEIAVFDPHAAALRQLHQLLDRVAGDAPAHDPHVESARIDRARTLMVVSTVLV